ncbi:MAG: hypothetical protein WBB19_14140 [Desulforhopalus sp.]
MTSITEYAAGTSIPKRTLRYLNREGIVQDPLCREDLIGLRFLEQVWGKKELLRAQLSRLSMKARLSFLRTADLPTKWERYAYSRFRNLEPGTTLPMRAIIEEIQTTFHFLLNKKHINRLYKIRNRVQVARHREKRSADSDRNALLQSTNK